MTYKKWLTTTALGVVACAFVGCASPSASSAGYSLRQVPDRTASAVFEAADAALGQLGYVIKQRDPTAGVLRTRPVLTDEVGRRDPSGPRLSSQNDKRKVTEVRVEPQPGAVKLFCRVLIQEQTTQVHRMLATDYRGTEGVGDTAIDRDAATTPEQNTVWETIRRNRAEERAILSAILERLGTAPTP